MTIMGAPRGELQDIDRGSSEHNGARRTISTWEPLAGAALLGRLRNTGRARPPVDPALTEGLRSYLERGLDGLDGAVAGPGTVLLGTKDRLSRALSCAEHREPEAPGSSSFTLAWACGALVGLLFRQVVTVGPVEDAFSDALEGLSLVEHQAPLVEWIGQLAPSELRELQAEVERQAAGLNCRWPAVDPSWLPRTQESMRVSLAGGRVELCARVDLALGRPAVDEASVALVDVRSGARRARHRSDLHFFALLETLRAPAPPFAVATYYTRTGELEVDAVTPELLAASARRCVTGIRAMAQGHDGGFGSDTSFCSACAEAPWWIDGPADVPAAVLLPTARVDGSGGRDVVSFPSERAA